MRNKEALLQTGNELRVFKTENCKELNEIDEA